MCSRFEPSRLLCQCLCEPRVVAVVAVVGGDEEAQHASLFTFLMGEGEEEEEEEEEEEGHPRSIANPLLL